MVAVPGVDAFKARCWNLTTTVPIIRGERRSLQIRMAAARDLPKLSSSCTTVVIARENS